MKNFTINVNGISYYKNGKKRILQHILGSPIFVSFMSLLFIIGAKNEIGIFFAYVLSFLGLVYFLFIIHFMIRSLNRTISFISIVNEEVCIETFAWCFVKSKKASINLQNVKIHPHVFRITQKQEEKGWKIWIDHKQYYLMKNFFDEDVEINVNKN